MTVEGRNNLENENPSNVPMTVEARNNLENENPSNVPMTVEARCISDLAALPG
jgi:hypothetical protein